MATEGNEVISHLNIVKIYRTNEESISPKNSIRSVHSFYNIHINNMKGNKHEIYTYFLGFQRNNT